MCKILQKINAGLSDLNNRKSQKMQIAEPYRTMLLGFFRVVVTAELFYGNKYFAILFVWLLIPLRKRGIKRREEKERMLLGQQFADVLNSISFAVEVGYSIENAVREAYKDIRIMYGDNALIVKELKEIIGRMEVNITIEQAFEEFAHKSGNDDICYFANVLALTKRSGGNLGMILKNTAYRIHKKLEVKAEIDTIVSGKKMEQTVMSVIPYGMIAYLRLTSPEFVVGLYGNIIGIVIMTACLFACIFSGILSKRFLKIDV